MKRVALLALVLSGCTVVGYPAGTSSTPVPLPREGPEGSLPAGTHPSAMPEGVPHEEPLSRYGNPASYEQFGERYHVMESAAGYEAEGVASWYGQEFAGRRTSSGEVYDPELLTAAHRTLPLPTWAEVTNLRNGRRVIVRINDRGPFAHTSERLIDLSRAAAREIGLIGPGIGPVRIRALTSPVRPGG